MKELQDISSLITIRAWLAASIDNLGIKLSREDVKNIRNKVQYFDQIILEQSLKLDLSKLGKEAHNMVREFSIESSEDTEAVMKKFTKKDSEKEAESEA